MLLPFHEKFVREKADETGNCIPLDLAPKAYETFKQHEDGCIKVVLKPFETSAPGKVQTFAHELKPRANGATA